MTLLTPTNGTSLRYGTNVLLQATTSTNDSRIRRVEFFRNGTLIGTASNAPWGLTWTNPPVGDWTLTAVATDVDGDTLFVGPRPLSASGSRTCASH